MQQKYDLDQEAFPLEGRVQLQDRLLEHVHFKHLHDRVRGLTPLPGSQFTGMIEGSPPPADRTDVPFPLRRILQSGLYSVEIREQVRIDLFHLAQDLLGNLESSETESQIVFE